MWEDSEENEPVKQVRFAQELEEYDPVDTGDDSEDEAQEDTESCAECQSAAKVTLDLFKAFQMPVHPDSRGNTDFTMNELKEARDRGVPYEKVLASIEVDWCDIHNEKVDEDILRIILSFNLECD